MYAPVSLLTKVLDNLQRYSRFYLAGFLALLLAALLLLSAQAQARPRVARWLARPARGFASPAHTPALSSAGAGCWCRGASWK